MVKGELMRPSGRRIKSHSQRSTMIVKHRFQQHYRFIYPKAKKVELRGFGASEFKQAPGAPRA